MASQTQTIAQRFSVLYIVDDYHSVSQTFVRREVDMLREQGVRVGCFSLHPTRTSGAGLRSPRRRKLLRAAGALATSRSGRGMLREVFALARNNRRRGPRQLFALLVAAHVRQTTDEYPDHIHAHFFARCADIAYYLGRLSDLPYTVTGHGADVLAAPDARLLSRNASSAAGLVAVSDLVRERLRTLSTASEGPPIATIRSGVPRRVIVSNDEHSPAPSEGKPLQLVTVARLDPIKGFPAILAAARILQERGVEFEWQIVGDGPLREWIAENVASMDDRSPMQLLGARSSATVLSLVRKAHIFVLPCITLPDGESDGLPVAIIEALALGTPVITTSVAAIPELVRHEITGLLVPEGDGEAVADAIARLQDEPVLHQRLATEGRSLTLQSYVLEDQVARLREFLEDLSSKRSR